MAIQMIAVGIVLLVTSTFGGYFAYAPACEKQESYQLESSTKNIGDFFWEGVPFWRNRSKRCDHTPEIEMLSKQLVKNFLKIPEANRLVFSSLVRN